MKFNYDSIIKLCNRYRLDFDKVVVDTLRWIDIEDGFLQLTFDESGSICTRAESYCLAGYFEPSNSAVIDYDSDGERFIIKCGTTTFYIGADN